MKNLSIFILILTVLQIQFVSSAVSCQDYLINIARQYMVNKTQVQIQLAPYLLNSGKYLEDLGFPETCVRMKDANFSTIQFIIPQNHFNYTVYYGFCFTNLCTASDLNTYRNFVMQIIQNFTTINLPKNSELNVVYSPLEPIVKISAIVIYFVLSCLFLLGMIYSIRIWINQCRNTQENRQRFTFEDGQVYQQQQMTFLKRVSFAYKCTEYLFGKREKSNKIISFSIFKLVCIPMVILGEEFYFRNFASFNYFAFKQEIYTTFYSKLAMFSIYLPDTLLFISGFLLASKCLREENYGLRQFFQFLKKKFLRLYPIYFIIVLIYWLVSPTIYGGPVWYVYQNQVSQCNSRWWRTLLLIDNWFIKTNCFPGGWFVEVQMQCVLLCLVFFLLYSNYKKIGIFVYLISLVVMMVITIVFSPKMPVSLQNTLSHHFFDYFKSTYGHLLFYIFGIGVAMLKSSLTISEKIQKIFEKKACVQIILAVISTGMIILILLRPSIWATASGLQLSLSRLGAFISFLALFMGGIFRADDNENNSYVHKFAHYSYSVMLFSTIVTGCSVWGFSSLFFISQLNLLNLLITQMSMILIVGTTIGIMLDLRKVKK